MILPDVRGLHPFYEDLAVRFAEIGAHATAMDYFGRTAGTEDRGEDFDFMSHVSQITADGMGADTTTAIAQLRSVEPIPVLRRLRHGRPNLLQPSMARPRALRRDRILWRPAGQKGPDDETAPSRFAAIYDRTPHSFFDRSFGEHREACDDAWRRMLGFIGVAST